MTVWKGCWEYRLRVRVSEFRDDKMVASGGAYEDSDASG
jgi:hypothetical protein